ncbi:sulfatase-like hydrolase/transferase [Paenibacillus thermotolerans]|uniref:sulfatase-like hydrolase/transferase n=1 Tax=Paenibacillus thermotolerans TaxID=3027807 RepID=UPI00236861B7|nr:MULTISPECIES: sulfatase-like hydrolase/transferase [unclassified Paenibacillus]
MKAGQSLKKPNIVFILADDHGAWALGCAGNKELRTPHLDALASEGTRFDSFFCASPVCSPARASVLTGKIPSQHGVHDWLRSGNVDRKAIDETIRGGFSDEDQVVEYLHDQLAYTEVLAENGYSCALSGKWHLGNSASPQKGFTRWFTIAQGRCSYMRPEIIEDGQVKLAERYLTDLITDRALQFMDELSREEKPFYLGVHYTAPHSPWDRGEHPEQYFELYEDCPFLSAPELPPHPNQAPSCPVGVGEARKELLKGYYASITAMDAGIGKLLARLEKLGLKDDTLVVFMGDNGMNMGHHGVWGKGNGTFPLNMYDTSVKVPAIFRQPGVIPAGRVVDDMLSQYDVFPTLLEYADAKHTPPDHMPGQSFYALLTGRAGSRSRDDVVIFDEYGPVRMIRTKEWKYVHRYPYGPHELYDLQGDPDECVNRIDDPACRETVSAMRIRLAEWFRTYVVPGRDGVYAPVSGAGQLRAVWNGSFEDGMFMPLK